MSEYYFENIVRDFLGSLTNSNLDSFEFDKVLEFANINKIDIHYLKRLYNPRIQRIVGILEGIQPETLLDIGVGKGYLIWHLSERMPLTKIFACDIFHKRIHNLQKVGKSAKLNIINLLGDGRYLPYKKDSFSAVTIMEVLEHIKDPEKLAAESVRVSKEWIFGSVPSKPDDNPEHINLFTRYSLEKVFKENSIRSIKIEQDSGHFYFIVRK